MFGVFFATVAETLRDLLGDEWTDDIDRAWGLLLEDLDWYATHPDQGAVRSLG